MGLFECRVETGIGGETADFVACFVVTGRDVTAKCATARVKASAVRYRVAQRTEVIRRESWNPQPSFYFFCKLLLLLLLL